MIYYVNKIFIIAAVEEKNSYNLVKYESDKLVEVKIRYGKPEKIVDLNEFKKFDINSINDHLFPDKHANPIQFNKVDESTLILFYPPKDTLLWNSLLMPDDIDCEVLYSNNLERLFYLFRSFNSQNFKIVPQIKPDHHGLIPSLKDAPLNSKIRGEILKTIKANDESSHSILNVNSPNIFIEENLGIINIIYKGNKYSIKNSKRYRDILYLLSNEVFTNKLDALKMLWKDLSGKSSQTDNKLSILQCWQRYRNLTIQSLKKYEGHNKIDKNRLFSEFVKDNVKINSNYISCKISPPIKIISNFNSIK